MYRVTTKIISGLILLAAAQSAAADPYEKLAGRVAKAAVRQGYLRVAVLPLKPVNSRSQQGGLILSERLVSHLAGREGLQVVERTLLEKILKEQRLGLEGFIDQKQAQAVGKILGVDALLTGTFLQLGEKKVELHTRLIDAKTAAIVTAASTKAEKEWKDDDFALGSSWAVPVPKLDEPKEFRVPRVSMHFRDAPAPVASGSVDCSDWEGDVDSLQRTVIEAKARYWSTQLRDPGFDKRSLTRNPGSEIRSMSLRQLFYARTKELYRQHYQSGITLQQQGSMARVKRQVEQIRSSCY